MLAWCLVVALPVQGYAAQALRLCDLPVHASSASADHAGMAHEQPTMADSPADHPPEAGTGAAAHQDDMQTHTPGKHSGTCSVGASCCSAPGLTSGVVTMAVVHPDLLDLPTVQLIRDRIMVGGLERPPRAQLP